jgi:hypothetical protein
MVQQRVPSPRGDDGHETWCASGLHGVRLST